MKVLKWIWIAAIAALMIWSLYWIAQAAGLWVLIEMWPF